MIGLDTNVLARYYIDDVVGKIRGPKGSIVRLGILGADEPSNAAPHNINLA